jgi:hypothetical protein
MNRRLFLSSVAAAGAAIGLGPASSAAESARAGAPPTRPAPLLAAEAQLSEAATGRALSRTLFAGARRARFTVSEDTPRRLELIAVRDAPPATGVEQFSVVFRQVDARVRPLAAGIHTLTHPVHGEIQLYLEPAVEDAHDICYRAALCLLS